jgi:hypothetical protein
MRSALLVIFALFFIFTPAVLAQEEPDEGDSCTYKEEHDDGFYNCQGTYVRTPVLICQFNEAVEPNCQKDPNQSAASGQDTNTVQTPSRENWFPQQQNVLGLFNTLNGMGCFIGPDYIYEDPIHPEKWNCPVGIDPTTGNVGLLSKVPGGGALGGVSSLILATYSNPSLSSNEYLASVGKNIGIKPAYAQVGTGNSSGDAVILPILKLWEIARNMAYVAFILVFVAVGFMIMLRSRINPQTVVTAQAAIPGLIIGLILVTFSYFIASLIVDLSFVGMNLVIFLFKGLGNAIQSPETVGAGESVLSLFTSFVMNGNHLNQLAGPVKNAFQATVPFFHSDIPILGGVGGAVGGVVGLLVMVVIMVAILIQMFRLLWALVQCYIAIFVTTIFGPFIILASSLPGRGGVLAVWWKSLLGNVLVFPAVFAAFLFAGVFLGNTDPKDFQQTLPLFAGLPVDILRVIIAYGIVLGTPAIPGMVKKALGVPDITGIPQAALAGVGASAGAAQGAYGRLVQPFQQERQAYREATMRARYPANEVPANDNPFIRAFQPGAGGGGLVGGLTRRVSRVAGWTRRRP